MPKTIGRGLDHSSANDNAEWIARQTKTPEARRLYEEERLITAVTEELAGAIIDANLTRREVADRIGSSRAHVTQALRGGRNLTLRTIAAISHATGYRVVVTREPLRDGVYISCPVTLVRNFRPQVVVDRAQDIEERESSEEMDLLSIAGG